MIRLSLVLALAMGIALQLSATASVAQGLTFKGYRCTQDCSGHIAGYNWAAKNRITSRSQCSGNSQSFVEGCWAYADGL